MCVRVCVCVHTLCLLLLLPLLCLAGKQMFKPLIVASSHPGMGTCPRIDRGEGGEKGEDWRGKTLRFYSGHFEPDQIGGQERGAPVPS